MSKKIYEIVDTGDDSPSNIKINETFAAGLIYRYGKIGVKEVNGQCILSFVYEVIDNPKDIDCEMPSVKKMMGDILVENIEDNLKDGVLVFGK